MTIPSASEARSLVEIGAYEKAAIQLKMVENAIRKGIAEGKFDTGGDGSLDLGVINQLKGLGYKAQNDTNRNESYWSVSW